MQPRTWALWPQDSSEVFRDKIEAQPPVAANDPNAIYHGGAFTAMGPFDEDAAPFGPTAWRAVTTVE